MRICGSVSPSILMEIGMSYYDYEEEYVAGFHELLQTPIRAARIDKKMQIKAYPA